MTASGPAAQAGELDVPEAPFGNLTSNGATEADDLFSAANQQTFNVAPGDGVAPHVEPEGGIDEPS